VANNGDGQPIMTSAIVIRRRGRYRASMYQRQLVLPRGARHIGVAASRAQSIVGA